MTTLNDAGINQSIGDKPDEPSDSSSVSCCSGCQWLRTRISFSSAINVQSSSSSAFEKWRPNLRLKGIM